MALQKMWIIQWHTRIIKKLEKLKKKLYKHVFKHNAPTKAERIEW